MSFVIMTRPEGVRHHNSETIRVVADLSEIEYWTSDNPSEIVVSLKGLTGTASAHSLPLAARDLLDAVTDDGDFARSRYVYALCAARDGNSHSLISLPVIGVASLDQRRVLWFDEIPAPADEDDIVDAEIQVDDDDEDYVAPIRPPTSSRRRALEAVKILDSDDAIYGDGRLIGRKRTDTLLSGILAALTAIALHMTKDEP